MAWSLVGVLTLAANLRLMRESAGDLTYVRRDHRPESECVAAEATLTVHRLLAGVQLLVVLIGVNAMLIPEPIRQENQKAEVVAGVCIVLIELVLAALAWSMSANRRRLIATVEEETEAQTVIRHDLKGELTKYKGAYQLLRRQLRDAGMEPVMEVSEP